jgi:hypothetical protein
MAKAKKRTPVVEEVRPYVEGVAKNLVDKLYGPAGPPWGTKLSDIEDLLLEIREVLTEQMLDLTLARQAEALPQQPQAERCCPSCQQPLACEDANQRITQTRAGEAQWTEPEGYCSRCRRAFFPSGQKPGHRSD